VASIFAVIQIHLEIHNHRHIGNGQRLQQLPALLALRIRLPALLIPARKRQQHPASVRGRADGGQNHIARAHSRERLQRLLRQYLYVCASKASKLRTFAKLPATVSRSSCAYSVKKSVPARLDAKPLKASMAVTFEEKLSKKSPLGRASVLHKSPWQHLYRILAPQVSESALLY
jgi:hypothetical protein